MRGEPGIVELIDRAEWIGIPSIALGELHSGFLAGRHAERNEEELERFLSHPVVEELAVDHDVARIYAEIVLSLRRMGRPLPTNDIWIAASAARAGETLLAYDAHFAAIERIGVVVLEAPSA
jgi:predicted nucleic acid-binding protein